MIFGCHKNPVNNMFFWSAASPNTLACRIHSNPPNTLAHFAEYARIVSKSIGVYSAAAGYTRTRPNTRERPPNTLERRVHSNKKSHQRSKKHTLPSKKNMTSSQNSAAEYTRMQICRFFSMVPGRVCHKVQRGVDAIDINTFSSYR